MWRVLRRAVFDRPGGDFAILTEITDFQAAIGPDDSTVTTRVRFAATIVREVDRTGRRSAGVEVDGVAPSPPRSTS